MKYVLICIAVMAITTYLIRMLPLVIFKKKITNIYVRSFMEYVPCVVLSCMTFPTIFTCTQNKFASFIGSIIAVYLGFKSRSLVEVAIAAVSCVLIITLIFN